MKRNVSLVGGDQQPGFILIERAEIKAGVHVQWLAEYGIGRTRAGPNIDVMNIKKHIDAKLQYGEGLFCE